MRISTACIAGTRWESRPLRHFHAKAVDAQRYPVNNPDPLRSVSLPTMTPPPAETG